MNTIWKYTLDVTDTQELYVPFGAELLKVGVQNDEITLWFRVDTNVKYDQRRLFEVHGTGNPMPGDGEEYREYIDSVFIGPFVWHVFEVKEQTYQTFKYNVDAGDFRQMIESGKWRAR